MSPDLDPSRTYTFTSPDGSLATTTPQSARQTLHLGHGQSAEHLIEALATVRYDEPHYPQAQALKGWWQVWLEDRDWQKFLAHGMTTSERCQLGVESADSTHAMPQSNLSGSVHR
jgi:hypothetical protein